MPATKTPTPPTGGAGSGSGSATAPPVADVTLDTLTEGAKVRGFVAQAVYLDDADKPIGARLVHEKSGFTFDYLRIESAPQAYIWVGSYPTSNKGEPHTQEHLLLGKGDRGRKLGSNEAMSLARSSAFTAQWHTAYHLHTIASPEVYWHVFEDHLDALLNPDYTDEEIRREVRNFGVDKGDDGKLRLEEQGTVYNEMVRSYEQPDYAYWYTALRLMYGPAHPLALSSGGRPDAIRVMTPEDIRKFHASAYHLRNMGVIGAYPSTMAFDAVLERTNAILDKAMGRGGKAMTDADLPKPAPAAAGTIEIVEYPYNDSTNPGNLVLAYPPTRDLDDVERILMALFLDAFAGDESTNLYKKLVDSKTRTMDLGATGVWSHSPNDQGLPVMLGLTGVKADKLDKQTVTDVRVLVLAELDRMAKLPDGDAELVAFDQRVLSRVVDLRRRMAKFLDSPPGFGFRGSSDAWMMHLYALAKAKGFKKSVTLRPELTKIEEILRGGANPWRERLRTWGLLEAPFGIASPPSPALRKKLDDERKARIDAELARLMKQYGTTDEASTLAKFKADYDAETKKLESSQATQLPPLVDSPPMTLDDNLLYTTGEIVRTPSLVATFDAMTSSRVQLSFRVNDAVPPDDQMFLAALPSLLYDAGVIGDDGKPISSADVKDKLRNEVLELSVSFSSNARSKRLELAIAGAGNNVGETQKSITWMKRVLWHPDWRIDNLPRLRDIVDQLLTSVRQRMLGAEESWVEDPQEAWALQDPLLAHADMFLTQAHDLLRLRWMLLDPQDAKVSAEATKWLASLADAKTLPRADLVELAKALSHAGEKAAPGAKKSPKLAKWIDAANALSPKARDLAKEAGKDLALLVPDLPDNSLAADWAYLAKLMAHDLGVGAKQALAKLEEVRGRIVRAGRERLVLVGSKASQDALRGDLETLVKGILAVQEVGRGPDPKGTPFRDRLKEREGAKADPQFVGLFAPSTSSGVFVNRAPSTSYSDTSEDAVLDYLASNLYTGHGAHSIFMKTWASGLAYSNGLRPDLSEGVLRYYAERCPLLPTTLKFVIGELKKAKPDPNLVRYAIAESFSSRIANGFEARASAMAANLADDLPPDLVRGFRTRLLELSKRADLADKLFARMEAVYARVLPGYGKLDPRGVYFVIGPDKQLAAYQDYLRAAVGKDATLYRLYPRDFWIPAKL